LPRQSSRVYTTGDRRGDDRPVYTPLLVDTIIVIAYLLAY